MKLGLLAAAILVLLLFFPSTTVTYERSPEMEIPNEPPAKQVPRSKEDIEQMILLTARRHGIDEERFLATAKCESSLRPAVIGDDGESYGLFQIHLKSHPAVTKEQAFDPDWAAEWSAKKFAETPWIWTCYRLLYE